MSDKTILVIDDSATIRRLVDTTLTAAGYRVLLASNAEDGLQIAQESCPDLILLDHQLPGTTGFEVCRQLHEHDELRQIPVVISSTLRKRAYAEYTDWANVVDMLPKPYTAELLSTTVANALDTGALVVNSQAHGSAVPEVICDPGDADLSGSLRSTTLRELLDFLNNGNKRGLLEVEADRFRAAVYLLDGRIQAVCASGIDTQELVRKLPESLHSLAPVLNLTVAGRSCSQVDGLVELLDRKVLDPRLLQRLLRFQAAMLLWRCFTGELKEFRFYANRSAAALYHKLPLEISVLGLLIEGAMLCDDGALPHDLSERVFVRRAIRGQNLDRTGVGAQHVKLLGLLSEPQTLEELTTRLDVKTDEMNRVLYAMMLAELVESQTRCQVRHVLAIEADAAGAQQFRLLFENARDFAGRVIRDKLALQLVLRRMKPDAIAVALDHSECELLAAELQKSGAVPDGKWIGISADSSHDGSNHQVQCERIIHRPYTAQQMGNVLHELFSGAEALADSTAAPQPC